MKRSTLVLDLSIVLAIILLMVSAAGCGEREEPLGELAQEYPVTVRGAGQQSTTLPRRPERIVALDPGSAELLVALGTGSRLVGVPAALGESSAAPVIRETGQIDVEAVVALGPELIVATVATDRVELARAARDTGAAVYLQPSTSIVDVERATLELGFLVGEPVRARELVSSIRRETKVVEERIANVAPLTVFVDTGFFITVQDRSLLGALLRRAHAQNVGAEAAALGPFNVTELVEADPDVYIATSDSGTTLATLRSDEIARQLSAVRAGRFVELDTELVTRAGPRVADALEAVATALHPDAFE